MKQRFLILAMTILCLFSFVNKAIALNAGFNVGNINAEHRCWDNITSQVVKTGYIELNPYVYDGTFHHYNVYLRNVNDMNTNIASWTDITSTSQSSTRCGVTINTAGTYRVCIVVYNSSGTELLNTKNDSWYNFTVVSNFLVSTGSASSITCNSAQLSGGCDVSGYGCRGVRYRVNSSSSWTYVSGNSNFITVQGLSSGTTYQWTYWVDYSQGIESGEVATFTTLQTPSTPGTISGPTTVCAGDGQKNYYISQVSGATSYTWSYPSGWSLTGYYSSGSDWDVYLTPGSNAQSGYIRVKANNSCGSSSERTVYVTVNTPPTAPTSISGTSSITKGQSTTLTASGGSAGSGCTYQWGTGTCGSNIISGQTNSSITVSPSATTTYWVRRVGTSPCGSTTTSCATQSVTVSDIYTITASAGTGGSISPNGSVSVTKGNSQTFTITPNSSYQINQVLVDGSNVGAVSSYTFSNVTANHTILATFNQIPPNSYTINVSPSPTAGGSVSGGNTYTSGASCTVSASANNGYTFTKWTEGNSQVSTSATYTFTVTTHRTLVANFTANPYTITFDKQGGTGGTSSVTATNGSAMPSATAPTKTGYTFGGYYTGTNGSGTQYYTASMGSARNWDKTANTTLYAYWISSPVLANDNCSSATALSCGTAVSGTMVGATPTPACPDQSDRNDVFYKFTADYSGEYTITFTKSKASDDMNVFLYSDCSFSNTLIVSWEPAPQTRTFTYDCTAGRTYIIRIDDFIGTSSNFTIKVDCPPSPTCTVTLDKQGGTGGTSSVTATNGSAMPSITIPTKAGYTFGGYYTATNCSGTQYYSASGGSARNWDKTSNTTLYACWVSPSSASVSLEFSPANVSRGQSAALKIGLTNSMQVTGLQIDVVLPSSVTADLDNVTKSSRCSSSHSITSASMGNNKYRFVLYSTTGAALSGTSGEIISIPLAINWNQVATSTTSLSVSSNETVASSPTGTEITIANASGTLNIANFIPGDVNGNGVVNISDVVVEVNYILGKNPSPFIFAAGDMNGNGVINVADLTLIVNVILTQSSASPAQSLRAGSGYELSLSNLKLNYSQGQTTGNMILSMKNVNPVTGFQFNLTLPDNVSLNEDNLDFAGRTSWNKHTISANKQSGNTWIILVYSSSNKEISGTSGELLSIPLIINANTAKGSYTVTPNAATISDPDGNEITPECTSGVLTVTSTTSIDEISDTQIRIYPNPAKHEISIQSGLPIEKVEICNLSGHTIDTEHTPSLQIGNLYTINISALPKGIYIVKIHTGNGMVVEKIVKE